MADPATTLDELQELALETLRHTLSHQGDEKLKVQAAQDILDRLPQTAKRGGSQAASSGRRQTNLFIAAGNGGQDLMAGLGSFLQAVTGEDPDDGQPSAAIAPVATAIKPRDVTPAEESAVAAAAEDTAVEAAAPAAPAAADDLEQRLRAEGLLEDD